MPKKLKKIEWTDERIQDEIGKIAYQYRGSGAVQNALSMILKMFEKRKEEIETRVEKDKKKMGADLAYYMDVREITG